LGGSGLDCPLQVTELRQRVGDLQAQLESTQADVAAAQTERAAAQEAAGKLREQVEQLQFLVDEGHARLEEAQVGGGVQFCGWGLLPAAEGQLLGCLRMGRLLQSRIAAAP
jgi:hypothetical protein